MSPSRPLLAPAAAIRCASAIHHDADSFDERGLFCSGPHEAAVYFGRSEYAALKGCRDVAETGL